jgi:glycosyltransferase involved in cell wall biosynthesis
VSGPRLCYVVTHPVTAKVLLRGQLRYMRDRGYHVTVIASPGPELAEVAEREGVDTIAVPMSRRVRLTEGPRAAWELLTALRLAKPDIINASTSKAALLGLLAARVLHIQHRIYLLRGLRLEGFDGPARSLLGAAEHASSACAHHVVAVSESLKRAFVDAGFGSPEKVSVIPSNGIDPERFAERSRTRETAEEVRRRYGIPAHSVVAGFVGRLVPDKGAADLVTAFERAAREIPDLRLMIVGGDLAGDSLPDELTRRLANNPRVILTGTVADPAPYYAAMDLLVFPSLREGLPNVPLEAAACELPAVGYRSTGVVDSIAHGETGLIVERGNVSALSEGLLAYARSAELRGEHGRAGRRRALLHFTNDRTWGAWAALYERLLSRPVARSGDWKPV